MKLKSFALLLVVGLLLGLWIPQPVRAQASPTIIYQTDYETEPTELSPACASTPGCYGGSSFWEEEWDDSCGPDTSPCIYQFEYYGNGNPVDTRYSKIVQVVESAEDGTEMGTFWGECVINFLEFDIYYLSAPMGGGYADESNIRIALSDDGTASFETPISFDHYDYRQDIELADLPGSVQTEWFHAAISLDNTEPMNAFNIIFEAAQQTHSGGDGDKVFGMRIDNLQVWCDHPAEFNWVRPLALEDEHPQWEMFDRPFAESLGAEFDSLNYWVNGFSEGFHKPVHSAVAGAIDSITPLSADDPICGYGAQMESVTVGIIHNFCIVYLPEEITQDGNQGYKLDLVEAYKVVVNVGDIYLTYLVYNAPAFIEESQEIGEGCVIGETIQLLNPTNAELTAINLAISIGAAVNGDFSLSGTIGITVELRSLLTNNGLVAELLQLGDNTPIPLYPSLTRYSTNDNPCMVTDPRFINCLETDPTLHDPGEWTVQGSVIFDNPGFSLLSSNALIKEVMALESDVEYGLSVDIQVIDPDPRVELKLGATVESHTILDSPGSIVTVSIESDIHLADLTDFWTVRVRNLSGAAFKVLSICVSAGEIAGQPTACYFSNPSFDQGYTNWDVSEGVGQRDGSITVPSDDTFAQEATLPADEPDTVFQLYVVVYIWTEPGVTISRTDFESTVHLEYTFPDDMADPVTLAGPSSGETTTFSEFALAAERTGVTIGTVSFQGFITIDEDTTGTITITPTIDTEVEGVLGVGIDRACLRGDFGIDQGDDDGGSCQAVTRPQDQLLSSWTVWLWRQFDRFFQCDLMIVLRQIRNTVTEIYRLTGWSIRYWKAAYFYNVQWLSTDLFPWMNGQFSNMAKGSQSTFYINNESGANLWDFLVALLNNTLGPLINGLASIINTLMVQLAGLLSGLLNFAGLVLSLIANLLMMLLQSITNLLTVIISGLINIILFILFALFSIVQLLISGIFTLIFTLLVLIFGLLGSIINLFLAIVTGWQTATPIPIPGLPTCETDPTTNYLCVPIYILNNTLFDPSGVGSLLITLIVGYGSFEMILWVIGEIRGVIMEATQAT